MAEAIGARLGEAWRAFVDATAPDRPALHNYCRRLTGNLWDAEDLVQDTLLRAFGQWGVTRPEIRNVRAYLLRAATNVWIDTMRRRAAERRALPSLQEEISQAPPVAETAIDVRAAGGWMMHLLSPQERAALVLKEAFDMPIRDIADLLATTEGAVKAALHRGRERIEAGETHSGRRRPSPELLDRFIDRFNARDVKGLTALMLEGGSADNPGNSFHIGTAADDGVSRFFDAVVNGHKDWPAETQFESNRLERREVEDDLVLLGFVTRKGREALMSVFRIDEEEGRIARIRSYGFCPETIRAIGEMLGVRVFTGLYRAPSH